MSLSVVVVGPVVVFSYSVREPVARVGAVVVGAFLVMTFGFLVAMESNLYKH